MCFPMKPSMTFHPHLCMNSILGLKNFTARMHLNHFHVNIIAFSFSLSLWSFDLHHSPSLTSHSPCALLVPSTSHQTLPPMVHHHLLLIHQTAKCLPCLFPCLFSSPHSSLWRMGQWMALTLWELLFGCFPQHQLHSTFHTFHWKSQLHNCTFQVVVHEQPGVIVTAVWVLTFSQEVPLNHQQCAFLAPHAHTIINPPFYPLTPPRHNLTFFICPPPTH